MNDSNINDINDFDGIIDCPDNPPKRKHNPWLRALAITGIVICSVIFLVIAAAVGLTLYLTPERLAKIINEKAPEYVDAMVHLKKVDYTIWSSFPNLNLEIDTLTVIPTNLSAEDMEKLPPSAKTLLKLTKVEGSINIVKLFKKEIALNGLVADGLKLNLAQIDSVRNNYSIIPPDELATLKKFKISGFTAGSVALTGNPRITFYSGETDTDAVLDLHSFHLVRQNTGKDTYHLFTDGTSTLSLGPDKILDRFPFSIGGNMFIAQDISGAALDDFSIKLCDLLARINMTATIGKDISIDNLSYEIPGMNVASLLDKLPEKIKESLPPVRLDMDIRSHGSLTAPFLINGKAKPDVKAEVVIDNGSLSYSPVKSAPVNVNDLNFTGELVLTSSHPEYSILDITRLTGKYNGMELSVKALARNLLAEKTNVDASLKIDGKPSGMIRSFIPSAPMISGVVKSVADVGLVINDLTGNPSLSDIHLNATADLENVKVSGKNNMRANLDGGILRIDGKADRIDNSGIANGNFAFGLTVHNAIFNSDSLSASVSNLKLNGDNSSPLSISFGNLSELLPPLDLTFAANSASATVPVENVKAKLTGLNGTIHSSGKKAASSVSISGIDLNESGLRLKVNNVTADLGITRRDKPVTIKDSYSLPAASESDSILLATADHTPEALIVPRNTILSRLLKDTDINARIKIVSGRFFTKAFPSDNTFRNLDLAVNNDSVRLRNLYLHTGGCGINLKGNVSNMRQFLAGRQPEKLRIRMGVDIDSLDINRLARVYENGVAATQGIAATLPSPMPTAPAPSDSVIIVIPRNIDAIITANANHLLYTDLDVSDISTKISVNDGVAKLSDLIMHTPFADAEMNFTYSTSDLQDIFLEFDADMTDIDITRFFDCYRNTLLKMMPYMSNLSGVLSAEAKGKITMFPTNYLDIPSLTATLDFHGRNLKIHQSKFIHNIARLMLIRHKGDLLIHNMDICANVHDNLVELDPFLFEMDRYKFISGGLNNFDGDMFYHIGVEHSPIPFPFGVNILGSFEHPRLRFGGAGLKPSDSEKVSSQIMEQHDINLLMNLKYYFSEFLKKASSDYKHI